MMRKIFKQLFLTCLMLTFSLASNAQKESYDWSKVINAIIQVESKGNTNAVSKDCAGVLQIRPILVQDVNEYLKMKKINKHYTLKDRFNAKKSKEMFVFYQKRYNPTNSVEKAIRLWNGGCGYSKVKTENYYRKVMKHYNNGGK